MIKLTCANPKCGKSFERAYGEVNRKKNRGKPTYCSIACGNQVNRNGKNNGNTSYFKGNIGRKKDELTPFRYAMNIMRNRKNKHCEVDELYLKEIWEQQKGKCLFTGWDLILPEDSQGWRGQKSPKQASVDRIDNSKGYVKGNIRFVSVMFNYARNNFEDKDVIEFCKAVCKKELDNKIGI